MDTSDLRGAGVVYLGSAQLTTEEMTAIGGIMTMAARVGALVAEIAGSTTPTPDSRWLEIARSDLQKGFMALRRSVENVADGF